MGTETTKEKMYQFSKRNIKRIRNIMLMVGGWLSWWITSLDAYEGILLKTWIIILAISTIINVGIAIWFMRSKEKEIPFEVMELLGEFSISAMIVSAITIFVKICFKI